MLRLGKKLLKLGIGPAGNVGVGKEIHKEAGIRVVTTPAKEKDGWSFLIAATQKVGIIQNLPGNGDAKVCAPLFTQPMTDRVHALPRQGGHRWEVGRVSVAGGLQQAACLYRIKRKPNLGRMAR